MVYTNKDKNNLPCIRDLVDMIGRHVQNMPVRHLMPYDHAVDGKDKYLLNRTASGLFSLKPNITEQACLFYGEPTTEGPLTPALWHYNKPEYKVLNVLREEFELVMESHPLYRLLAKGIPTPKGLFRVINPYGIAMAYGFPTAMLPLTSSLYIAAFFATHKQNKQTGTWEPIPVFDEGGHHNYGTLYFMELAQPFPTLVGLSTIGMQAFQRPGAQKLFGFNIPNGFDFKRNKLVTGFEFMQNPESASFLTKMFEGGQMLTPRETIAQKANDIQVNKVVSEDAFKRNCRNNPADDFDRNRVEMEDAGIRFVQNSPHLFSKSELEQELYPNINRIWDSLCGDIIVVHPGFDKVLEALKQCSIESLIKEK